MKAGMGAAVGGNQQSAKRVKVSRPGGPQQSPAEVVKAEEGEEGEGEAEENAESPEYEAGEEEGEQEGMTEKAKKSLTVGDLSKSLDALETFAKSGDLPSRKEYLLGKATGEELTKSERDELFNLLGGNATPDFDSGEDSPGESIVKSMSENDNLQKALDVSDYLQEQHTEMVKSLRRVGEEIEKSDHRRHEFNLILAKAVKDIGDMVKGLADTVETLAGQPARGPKSAGITTQPGQVLSKSFAGQPASGDSLRKSEVLDALGEMMDESMAKGRSGATDFGEDLALATAKYEQTNLISKGMLSAVREHLARGATA